MDHNSLIDRESFEVCVHAEDHPKVFICDKLIAPSISKLNKKGYRTIASCSGHYSYSYYEWFNVNINELEKIKSNSKNIIKRIDTDSFDYISEIESTRIYVLFDEKYLFDSIPDGYKISDFNGKGVILDHKVDYYKNGSRRKQKDVVNEIEEYCKILDKWASELPERKGD